MKGVGWGNVARVAARKLDMLDYAAVLTDLASPPGNRLEALKGERRGQRSIRCLIAGRGSVRGCILAAPGTARSLFPIFVEHRHLRVKHAQPLQ